MPLLTLILLAGHSRRPEQSNVEVWLISAMCRLLAWRLHRVEFSATSVLVAKFLPHFLRRLLLPSLFFFHHSTLPLHLRQSYCVKLLQRRKNNQNHPFGIKPTARKFGAGVCRQSCKCLLLIISNLYVLDLRKLGCHQNHDKESWGFQKGAKESSPDDRRSHEGTIEEQVKVRLCFLDRQVYLTFFLAGGGVGCFSGPLWRPDQENHACHSWTCPTATHLWAWLSKIRTVGDTNGAEGWVSLSDCGHCPAIGLTNPKSSSLCF